MKRYEKVLDFKDGTAIYATSHNGFIPVGMTYDEAIEKCKELTNEQDQNLALIIVVSWI